MNSCRPDQDSKDENTNNSYVEKYNDEAWKESLIKKMMAVGDTSAYEELYYTYTLSEHKKEWFYYAFEMANNFDYPTAYLHLYFILKAEVGNQQKTNKLANYYLLKAYEKGVADTKAEIVERLGDSLSIPSSAEYLKLIE